MLWVNLREAALVTKLHKKNLDVYLPNVIKSAFKDNKISIITGNKSIKVQSTQNISWVLFGNKVFVETDVGRIEFNEGRICFFILFCVKRQEIFLFVCHFQEYTLWLYTLLHCISFESVFVCILTYWY